MDNENRGVGTAIGIVLTVLAILLLCSIAYAAASPKAPVDRGRVDSISLGEMRDVVYDTHVGAKLNKQLARSLLKVEQGYGEHTTTQMVMENGRLTLYISDNVRHDGRWFAVSSQLLERFGIDVNTAYARVDGKPAMTVRRVKADGTWLYFYIDHFSTRSVTFDTGLVEYHSGLNETAGSTRIIDNRTPNGTVLWFDFSPSHITYNETSGYYEVADLSGQGNNGTIYGLTGNTLSNTTAIDVDTTGEHTLDVPYYNNITTASLKVYYNNTGGTDISVSVSLNGNDLGSFVAAAGTAGNNTFSGVEGDVDVNATNTVSYSSNGSVSIEKVELLYEHDLTLVQQPDGTWALRFDGVDDYVDCGNDVSLNFGSGNFTVALWFRSYSVGAAHIMIATQETDYPYEGWLLGHYGASKIRFAGKDAAHTNFAAEFSFTDTGGFHHLVAIREGQSFRLYLDGSLKDDATAAVDNIPFNDILSVGARPAPISAYYDGVISEVSIHNTSQPAEQIKLSYALLSSGYRYGAEVDEEVQPTVDSVSFDGSSYTVAVNITLPSDGNGHFVYVPSAATMTYPSSTTVVGNTTDSEGNTFRIVDVGTASYTTYTLSVPSTLLPPNGLNLLVFPYNNELYVCGKEATLNATNFTAVNVPDIGTWISDDCLITNHLNASLSHRTLYFSTPTATKIRPTTHISAATTSWLNYTVLSYDPAGDEIVRIRASGAGRATFSVWCSKPTALYDTALYIDGEKVRDLDIADDGTVTFSVSDWSEHTISLRYKTITTTDLMDFTSVLMVLLIVAGLLLLIMTMLSGMLAVEGIGLILAMLIGGALIILLLALMSLTSLLI